MDICVRRQHMLIIIGVFVSLTTVVITMTNLRLPRLGPAATLGFMSEQWLSEHRASHS